MATFAVRHRTHYRFSRPVGLGPHRLVLRPRDSHDLRLVEATLAVTPTPVATRWLHDVHDNSIAVLAFTGTAEGLEIESRLTVDHYGFDRPAFPLEPFALTWPFAYRTEEWPDLEPWTRRQWADPEGRLARWVRELTLGRLELPTQNLLVALMERIRSQLPYRVREEEGIQGPLTTLAQGGSCRDLAVLMIEAVRVMGFAARFASGYLHAPKATDGSTGRVGGGATHAWAQVYLPGAGWIDFDPTNAIYGGKDLIRVGVARDPARVAPVAGSFTGPAGVIATLAVEVEVTPCQGPAAGTGRPHGRGGGLSPP